MLVEAKQRYFIEFGPNFSKDLKNLPSEFNVKILDDTLDLLRQGKKLNKEYKRHFLNGKNIGTEDIHIPDPNAYTGSEYSDWMLWFRIDERKKIIYILRTGTHAYLSGAK